MGIFVFACFRWMLCFEWGVNWVKGTRLLLLGFLQGDFYIFDDCGGDILIKDIICKVIFISLMIVVVIF